MREYSVDAVIFGGGVAGLWALNALDNAGYSTVLIERTALGDGQTIQSQGIIHGGIKYAFGGMFMENFIEECAAMPQRWKEHLGGSLHPDLSSVVVNSRSFYLWMSQKGGFMSKIKEWATMVGSMQALVTKPEPVPKNEVPDFLQRAHSVMRVAEPVIDTGSLLAALAAPHAERILYHGAPVLEADNGVRSVHLDDITLNTAMVVLAAGKGNAQLASQAGLDASFMQTRLLQQVIVHGDIPVLYAHCIDGALKDFKPDHTITTHYCSDGSCAWNVGGRAAEGNIPREERIANVQARLAECYPLDMDRIRLDTFEATRAEPAYNFGRVYVASHGNVIVTFPMKLATAPILGDLVVERAKEISPPSHRHARVSQSSIRIAKPPWD